MTFTCIQFTEGSFYQEGNATLYVNIIFYSFSCNFLFNFVSKMLKLSKTGSFLNILRVIVSKNQRNRGHGQKIDFAHTLPV